MTAAIAAPVPAVRLAPLDRLPGTADDDPFLRLAAGWLVGHPVNTAKASRRDLEAWAAWCVRLGIHPLAAERHHVDAWVRHLTSEPQPRTGRPASAATVARKLSALSGFYTFGAHGAGVLTHSTAASVRRPKVSDESQAIGLTADELRRLLAALGRAGGGADLLRTADLRSPRRRRARLRPRLRPPRAEGGPILTLSRPLGMCPGP